MTVSKKNNPNSNSGSTLAIFDGKHPIRRIHQNDKWFFSIVDIIQLLTDSSTPRRYWSDLKIRLKKEAGSFEVYENIVHFKVRATDGKLRETDMADTRTILRIIQSISTSKAEPFKQWLAQVGEERAEETENPELAIERMRDFYRGQGRDDQWINARIQNAVVRNDLTDEWSERGANEGQEFAVLTNIINKNTFGVTIAEHKEIKSLKKENLRDHETNLELALTTLGEATSAELHRNRDTQGFEKLQEDASEAGKIAGNSRREIEKKLGRSVVTSENFLSQTKPGRRIVKQKTESKPETKPDSQLSMFDNNSSNETQD